MNAQVVFDANLGLIDNKSKFLHFGGLKKVTFSYALEFQTSMCVWQTSMFITPVHTRGSSTNTLDKNAYGQEIKAHAFVVHCVCAWFSYAYLVIFTHSFF